MDAPAAELRARTPADAPDARPLVLDGHRLYLERLWRDAKLLEIGGGTLEAHHKNMTRDLASVEKIL